MNREKILSRLKETNNLCKRENYIYRGIADSFDLSESALWILYFLRMAEEPCSQKEICDRMFQSKQTVNSAIKKLEEEGLLELVCRDGNKKSKRITLTPAGTALAERTADRVIEAEAAAMDSLTDEEQGLFLSLYDKFVSRLQTEMDMVKNGK